MKTTVHSMILAGSLAAFPALAGETLKRDQITTLIAGNTLYVQIPPGAPGAPDGGVAPIYYGSDGYAAAVLPTGLKLIGAWGMADNGYCVDWKNGPKNSCSILARAPDHFVILDASTSNPRGTVHRIVTGNPEGL